MTPRDQVGVGPPSPDGPLGESRPHRAGGTPRRWPESIQPKGIAGLTLVWVMLWGDLTVANVLAGLVVSVVVVAVFPLPPLRMHLKIRPVRLAWLVMHFCYSLVVASTQVARTTLRFGHTPRNAVVKVDLRSSSDFVLTVVAEMTSLVPGSLVIEADRARHRLFVHILDVSTRDDVERFRRRTLALERRVVLALGAQTDHLELADPLPGEATR